MVRHHLTKHEEREGREHSHMHHKKMHAHHMLKAIKHHQKAK